MNHNCGTYGCAICENLKFALKLQELIKKETHEQVGTPWGFKLQSLVEKSEK